MMEYHGKLCVLIVTECKYVGSWKEHMRISKTALMESIFFTLTKLFLRALGAPSVLKLETPKGGL